MSEMSAPTIRIRIAHKTTVARGWEHEKTVEVSAPNTIDGYETLKGTVALALQDADIMAREETRRRNILDGR